MLIIAHPWKNPDLNLPAVDLLVDRFKLQKRRWRGIAEDGTEFGFELDEPLTHGAIFHQTENYFYRIRQEPESVLEVNCSHDIADGLRVAWSIGNLHMPLQLHEQSIRVADDSAVRQLLERMHVHFHESIQIFQPIQASTNTGHHHHGHDHSDGPHHSHG